MLAEVERFIDWIRMRNPQAKTWRDYKCDLKLFIDVTDARRPQDMHPRDIDAFVNFQVGRGYKASTINRRLAAVTSLFTFLSKEDKHVKCPVLPKRHYLREPQRLPRPVSEPNLRTFFAAVHDARDRAMFALMLRCGLRISEVAGLKLEDLYLGEAPSRIILRGKGARERAVYLSSEAERDLQHWLSERPDTRCDHVFISYQHKRLSTTSITIRINRARKISGVNLTAHRLRHTFADHLLSAGMPITSIQKLMGHRFVETTQTYALANDKQVEADFYSACEKLEGWKLLLQATRTRTEQNEANNPTWSGLGPEQATEEQSALAPFEIPARILSLPAELVEQLEAYRQLKVNRWRIERVKANSVHYYSQHAVMWGFFRDVHTVEIASELRMDHVLEYMKYRLAAAFLRVP